MTTEETKCSDPCWHKTQLMEALCITSTDLLVNKSTVIEKLFCAALINKIPIDDIPKVLELYQQGKQELFPK